MTKSKLGLFGDSFGVVKSIEPFPSWVTLLSKHFDILNYCESGVGEYKILKQLQNINLEKFDHIIITHTSATRVYVKDNLLHSNSEYHKNCDIIYADIEGRKDEFSKACQNYFKYIFDLDYAIDIHNLICKEINQLVQEKSVTHITHFDYTKLYHFSNMINFFNLFEDNRGTVNHYNEYGNYTIYQTLLKNLCLK